MNLQTGGADLYKTQLAIVCSRGVRGHALSENFEI